MWLFKLLILNFALLIMVAPAIGQADEPSEQEQKKDWQLSAGAGLIFAPAFTGARNYNLLAVPDLRVAYKELFFANVRDGAGYAVINRDGWRIGPVVTYTFSRSEKDGGSVFRIAGDGKNALQGMGDVAGTVSVGGFAEYSQKPYKIQLHLHKGVTGHEGVVVEGRASYGGVIKLNGPPLIYSFGPQIKAGDQKYTNAYWGISPEQSLRSGLERYHADGGVVSYGVNAFALMKLTKTVSVSAIAAFERLAPVVVNSPLVRSRGSDNQALLGLFVSYGF